MLSLDLHNPNFWFDVYDIKHPSHVYEIFRKNGITKAYIYVLAYKDLPFKIKYLKVGMSHPSLEATEREYQVGERVVRQLSWIDGWDGEPISSNGQDLKNGIKRLQKTGELPKKLNKNDLIVAVWDITARIPNLDPNLEINNLKTVTEWAEGEMCNQIIKEIGFKPPCNFRNPANSKAYKKGYYDRSILDEMFIFEGSQ